MSLDRKTSLTVVLLTFVGVTVVTLGVKEARHVRAVAEVETARASTPATPPAALTAVPRSTTADATVPPGNDGGPGRVARRTPVARPNAVTPGPPAAVASASTLVVTYFHTTARCPSCLRIEDLTVSTLTSRFAEPLATGRMKWRHINVDDPENAHFIKEYGLYTKSVVVSEVHDGQERRWKVLDKVWKLLGDAPAFQDYVEAEVKAYLESV